MPTIPRRALPLLALLTACTVVHDGKSKEDTTVAAPAVSASQLPAGDSAAGGVPAVPGDSATRTALAADTGGLELYPVQPRRGGVLFAFARGLTMQAPHCAWKGAALPCYPLGGGVLATVPLSAKDAAGTATLTFDRPSSRLTRDVTVADRPFPRELVFLDPPHWALLQRGADIARDARAIRAVLAAESTDRAWQGRWKEPLPMARAAGYGADRFYFRATDSSRAVTLPADAVTHGPFGTDTTATRPADVPGWRHAGTDIPAARGTPIAAPAGGTVVDVGDYVLGGHTVILDHGQGVHSLYFHLDTALVRKGDIVRQGQTIARVGDTGLVTGPHLHYGVYVHGEDVDPVAWRDMPDVLTGDTARVVPPAAVASDSARNRAGVRHRAAGRHR